MHRTPLQTAGLDLGDVLIETRQILHRGVELIVQKLNILRNVFIIKLPLLEQFQLLEDFALLISAAAALMDFTMF